MTDIKTAAVSAIAAGVANAAADPSSAITQSDVHAVTAAVTQAAAPALADAQARLDYATNNESLLTSYSATGGLTVVVGSVFTIIEKLSDGYQPVVDNPALLFPVVTLLGGAWVLYGRLFRSKPIGQ